MKNFFKCSKFEKILLIILFLILLTKIVQIFSSYMFKPNKKKIDNITFYCENFSNYGNKEESIRAFNKICEIIAARSKENPFFNSKKNIRIIFCSNHKKFRLFNTIGQNCLGITYSFFNSAIIICNKTDFISNLIEGGAKEYNTDSIIDIVIHELTHAYLTKYVACINRLVVPLWKEEGICQCIAASCTYDIDKGVHNFLNDISDSSGSYKYFTFYLSVTYLLDIENKSIDEIFKDKRNLIEIRNSIKHYDEKTVINWMKKTDNKYICRKIE